MTPVLVCVCVCPSNGEQEEGAWPEPSTGSFFVRSVLALGYLGHRTQWHFVCQIPFANTHWSQVSVVFFWERGGLQSLCVLGHFNLFCLVNIYQQGNTFFSNNINGHELVYLPLRSVLTDLGAFCSCWSVEGNTNETHSHQRLTRQAVFFTRRLFFFFSNTASNSAGIRLPREMLEGTEVFVGEISL